MHSLSLAAAVPGPQWRNALTARLGNNENVLATLEVDIDAAMHFNTGALALTDRRLLAWAGIALDNSRFAGLAGLNSTPITLIAGKVPRRISTNLGITS